MKRVPKASGDDRSPLRTQPRVNAGRVALVLLMAVVLGAIVFFATTSRPAIAATDGTPPAFPPAQVARGAQLAAMGDCLVCHTAVDGKPYAGGRPLDTPFGTLYATNITPDPETGIGRWSQAAFTRAMREGVSRDGSHLYPAFPYDHFRLLTDDDVAALYAFMMTRQPVSARAPRNDLYFPLGFRPLLAGWKLLFLHDDAVAPESGQTAELQRGAYLVHGIAHCGACHTPRNFLGAEKRDQAFAGGEAEGWHAPALNTAAPAPVPWTVDAMVTYLSAGIAPRREVAAGPMAPVTHDLSRVDPADVRAIAAYMLTQSGEPSEARKGKAERMVASAEGKPLLQATGGTTVAGGTAASSSEAAAGAAIYAGACAACHDSGRGHFFQGGLNLRLSTSVNAPTPDNLAQIVLHGIAPADGERGAWMPAFAASLTEDQLVALLTWIRAEAASEQPGWRDLSGSVRKIMKADPHR